MPPESLFLHNLRCPFPLDLDPSNYRNTLHSSSLLNQQNAHLTIQDHNQELCFSLDDYLSNIGSVSFFYQDCPAAVAMSDFHASTSSSKKTLALPGILCMECANVVCLSDGEAKRNIEGFDEVGFRVLGSDLWFIRREVESWRDYEHMSMYSFNVFCAILGIRTVKVSDLRKWVLLNSPRFGVVIDVYMRDHISVLVGLCLKAVISEALGFLELVKIQELERGLKSMNLKCPVLKQVLMWLASQLSVLYGHCGKFFAVEIFKQCILESASGLLLFPLKQSLTESLDLKEGDLSLHASSSGAGDVRDQDPLERNANSGLDETVGETVHSKVIFVSHVAAAVAALHQRSLLEEKIRALRGFRVSQPLSSYQRMAEHAYLSSQADEERKKRPNYRPIIEHDGLPRQQSSNQESSKNKTREELLAEERDYKRRRMSYRGKKVKRTTLQVVRDIIEEYMEEIKDAGGIGCFEKGDQGCRTLPSKTPAHDVCMDFDDGRTIDSDLFEAVRGSRNYYRKQSDHDRDIKSTSIRDSLTRNPERSRHGHVQHGHLQEQGNLDREKHGDYYSRSTDKHRSRDRSHERSNHRREQDRELTGTRHRGVERQSSGSSKYCDYRPYYSASNSHRRRRHNDRNTDSLVQNAFEDRYDPLESHNIDEDNVSDGGNYVKPE